MNQPLNNLFTDVPGLKVGNAGDDHAKTGVTVVVCDEPAVASAHVMGGAPGTRETDLMAPEQTVQTLDAVVLSGGSAFGLDAASGVMAHLAAAGRGFGVGDVRVPIVPTAILFDLINGGDKSGVAGTLYRDLGAKAVASAGLTHGLGSVGAGTGATTANLKGGLGAASMRLDDGTTVAALIAANPVGQVTIGATGHFWAAPFEQAGEFGGRGVPAPFPADATALAHKLQARARENTTIGIVATDAVLTKAEAKRLAVMAHDGLARAIWPAHTPFDGDILFALATGKRTGAPPVDMIALGSAAAACVTRAVARGIHAATPAPGDMLPTWRERFGG